MFQVRRGIFETNSSSTHSMTMCMQDKYDAWKNGKLYFVSESYGSRSEFIKKNFVTFEEAQDIIVKHEYDPKRVEEITKEFIEEHGPDYYIHSYDNYLEGSNLEFFEGSFTTPGGETVVAFGGFGYDG